MGCVYTAAVLVLSTNQSSFTGRVTFAHTATHRAVPVTFIHCRKSLERQFINKDTLACWLREAGIELLTFRLVDDLFLSATLLSHYSHIAGSGNNLGVQCLAHSDWEMGDRTNDRLVSGQLALTPQTPTSPHQYWGGGAISFNLYI